MNDRDSVLPSQRRRFLAVLLGGVGALLAAAAGWPLFRFLAPGSDAGSSSQVKLARDDIAVGGAHFFDFRGKPAVLLQPNPGEFVALSAVCTHLGCIVKWIEAEGSFLCHCHGGRFSVSGDVLGGPPPAPLESFPVALVDDQLVVG